MKHNTVTRTIAIATVVVCMLGSFYGCVQKGSHYKSFIASRANTDTVLTMEGMRMGQNLADSLNASSSHEINEVAIKKLRKTFEISNSDLSTSLIAGSADVEYFVKLDSAGKIVRMWYEVDCNTADVSKSEMLTAIVAELNRQYGVFSYYEYNQRSYGLDDELSKKLALSADTTLTQIIQQSQRDLELVDRDWSGGTASLSFVWKWKNQEIDVHLSNYLSHKIMVVYSKE